MIKSVEKWRMTIIEVCARFGVEIGLEVFDDGEYSWWPMDEADAESVHQIFHVVAVVCDDLRPDWVRPSPYLAECVARYGDQAERLVREAIGRNN